MQADVPAPPDLAELIDKYRAAMLGDDWRARCSTHRDLIEWPGFWDRKARRGVTYYHADVRVFKALASIKIGEWPRRAPDRAAPACPPRRGAGSPATGPQLP